MPLVAPICKHSARRGFGHAFSVGGFCAKRVGSHPFAGSVALV
jgi:hypothetical protein